MYTAMEIDSDAEVAAARVTDLLHPFTDPVDFV
jgi:hypothetical protein